MASHVVLYNKAHQQGGDVGLEVQSSDAGQGDGVGGQARQQEGCQRLDGRHQVEHAALEHALWLDDLPCNQPMSRSGKAMAHHC